MIKTQVNFFLHEGQQQKWILVENVKRIENAMLTFLWQSSSPSKSVLRKYVSWNIKVLEKFIRDKKSSGYFRLHLEIIDS